MLKQNALKRIMLASLSLLILLFIYLFPVKENGAIENEITYLEALKMPIYLSDENNYVARINILKASENINSNIEVIISSLTENSKESTYLPNGFNPVIPKNTTLLSYELVNKVLKLDFSKELLNITKEKEVLLIEALIFSLCEFEEIDSIMIFVEGKLLENLPNSNEKLPDILNKNFGINKVYDITSIKNVDHTINYYLAKTNDYTYYIPITKVTNNKSEKVEIIIANLKTSPITQTNLISYLKASATLESYEVLEESINLSFNSELIADLSSDTIIEEVKYSIFLSVRDTYNVQSVNFNIPNDKNI